MIYAHTYYTPGLWLLASGSLTVHGQQRIQGDFTAMRFNAFVEAVENQTPYRFYYSPVWTDSLVVNVHSEGQPLDAILNQILSATNLRYAIAGDAVYITQEREIMTELASGFSPQHHAPPIKHRYSTTPPTKAVRRPNSSPKRGYTASAIVWMTARAMLMLTGST